MDYKDKVIELIKSKELTSEQVTKLEEIFPELKESEDEVIRKHLIKHFGNKSKEDWNDVPVKRILAWLEKQCEQKSYASETMNEKGDFDSGFTRMMEKEQKPAFEMKTPEESLGIDSDTYNKIVDECIYGDDKAAWSEEDDNCLSTIIAEFSKCAGKSVSKDEWMRCNDFLNSLKERVLPQPKQEVDLKKEMDDAFLENKCNITDNVSLAEFKRIAKHFFGLGMVVSNKVQKEK